MRRRLMSFGVVILLSSFLSTFSAWGQTDTPLGEIFGSFSLLNSENGSGKSAFGDTVDVQERDTFIVRGRVLVNEPGQKLPSMTSVTLSFRTTGGMPNIQMVRGDGTFEFRNVSADKYTVTLESPGFETVARLLLVSSSITDLTLNTGRRIIEVKRPPRDEMNVSIDHLRIPKSALKELARAQKESNNNNPEKAIDHLQRSLRIAPDQYQAYNNLAFELHRLGRNNEAIEALEKCISLNPNDALGYFNLSLIHSNSNEYQMVIELLSKTLVLAPHEIRAMQLKGEAHFLLGQYSQALDCFEQMAQEASENPVAYLRIAEVQLRLGNHNKVIEQYSKFLTLESTGRRAQQVRSLLESIQSISP